MIRGSVDMVTSEEIHGWAYAPGQMERVLVQAVLNHEIVGEATADVHRPDLAAAGFGDGNSGYLIKLFRPIDPLYIPFLVVKVNGGDAELPRAPMLGFKEFFSELHVAHPAAGRQRSVLGGLWTDRTDAAALLRGKAEIGNIPALAAPAIQQLIYNGFALISLQDLPVEEAWQDAPNESLGMLLDDDALLLSLRLILEDQPLATNVESIRSGKTQLTQPSARNPSPSPAECVEVLVPFGDNVSLDIVRDSHLLPEFTPHGASRWTSSAIGEAGTAGSQGLLDRHSLPAGAAAVMGPGVIYRVRCGKASSAVRLLCLPARGLPVSMAVDDTQQESVRENGVRVWA